MKKPDALFFDVDQTIYDSSQNMIIPSTIQAIREAQAKGIQCIICTGRPLSEVKDTVLDKDIAWDGYITSNGATILDKQYHLLKNTCFSDQQLAEIFAYCVKYHCSISLQTVYSTFCPIHYNDYLEKGFVFFNIEAPKEKAYDGEDVSMACIFQEQNFDYSLFDNIEGVLSIKGKDAYSDIIQAGIDKGYGLKHAKELFGFDYVMAFGDANNDLEMIEEADFGIAMGNGTPEVKAAAQYITDAMLEDGVYNFLKKFEII